MLIFLPSLRAHYICITCTRTHRFRLLELGWNSNSRTAVFSLSPTLR